MNRYNLCSIFLLVLLQCTPNKMPSAFEIVNGPDSLILYPVVIDEDSTLLYLPNDLTAELWAETPMMYNPTNMDVDYKGRIWVTEAVNYRDFNRHSPNRMHHQAGDRVMILEDTDGDGVADSSKLFVQDTDLVAPLGIAVIGDKIIVSCAPNLIQYTDSNGDDIPDKKEIIQSGFGGFDHDHSLHSTVVGPDGKWYFNTGNAGPHQVTDRNGWKLNSGSVYTGGTPYNDKNEGNLKSDDGRVWVGGLSLRMNKDVKDLKVMAHGFRNSYEITIDSYGNLWQNDNDDQVMACRTSFLMEGGNAGFFSKDGTRSWQADRRPWQDLFTAHWHQDDPGIMPASDNAGAGSPTGVAINESDALGKKYRGMVLSAEAGRNTIYAYWPQKSGAGYTMRRHNLISSIPKDNINYQWNNDIVDKRMWFRPSDICIGTDGALYIADWYDPIVGGHAMHDTIGYGRIIRIYPKGKKLTNPKLDFTNEEGYLQALKSPAINVRQIGYQALVNRKDQESKLNKLLADQNPYIKARAFYVFAQLDASRAIELCKKESEDIRVSVIRALKGSNKNGLHDLLDQFSTDSSRQVRREIAIAIRDLPYHQSKKYIARLLKEYPQNDRWYDAAFAIACDGKEDSVYNELILPNLSDEKWEDKLVHQLFTLHAKSSVSKLANQVALQSSENKSKLITAIAFIQDSLALKAMLSLAKNKDSMVASQAFWWLNFRKNNDWKSLMEKMDIKSLPLSKDQTQILQWQETLVHGKNENEKLKAGAALALSAEGGKLLLSLANNISLNAKTRDTISKLIVNNPDATVRALAADIFWRKTNNRSYQYSIEMIRKMQPDISNGKIKFETACLSCHRKNNIGKDIGPDLTAISQKLDASTLIDAIINPSAAIAFGYEAKEIITKDSRSYQGFIISEGSTVIIKDITGSQYTLESSQIRSKKAITKSLMSPANNLNLTDRDVADIIGYLGR